MRRIICVALAALTTGCASIVTGQNQPISVQARAGMTPVSGAECELTNDKGTWFVTSPGSATVTRSYDDLHVKCSRDGFEPATTTVKSTTKGMAFGNILVGGIIGAAVDMGSGAAYDYPSLITVRMTQVVSAPAPATAPKTESAEAMLVSPVVAPQTPTQPVRSAPTHIPAGLPPGTMILGPR